MSIPKIIHQTFKTSKLPFINRWHIARFRKKNPDYIYEFYDDQRIEAFLSKEFDKDILSLYKRINIGAAKADFFRYAVLYKKGGVYLDIDSGINGRLDDFILASDSAIIAPEGNPDLFVQWALIYEPNHPFLKKTMELICQNIRNNKYPHDVHQMTGPSVYTKAIHECLKESPGTAHRLLGVDYDRHFKFKYPLSKLLMKEASIGRKHN